MATEGSWLYSTVSILWDIADNTIESCSSVSPGQVTPMVNCSYSTVSPGQFTVHALFPCQTAVQVFPYENWNTNSPAQKDVQFSQQQITYITVSPRYISVHILQAKLQYSFPRPNCSTVSPLQFAVQFPQAKLQYRFPRPICSTVSPGQIAAQVPQANLHYSFPKPNCSTVSPDQIAVQVPQAELHYSFPRPNWSKGSPGQIAVQVSQANLQYRFPRPNCSTGSPGQIAVQVPQAKLQYRFPRPICSTGSLGQFAVYFSPKTSNILFPLQYTFPWGMSKENCFQEKHWRSTLSARGNDFVQILFPMGEIAQIFSPWGITRFTYDRCWENWRTTPRPSVKRSRHRNFHLQN
jgi:hypothetical protein